MATWPEARSAKNERDRRNRRHYTPDMLGALCAAGCGLRLPLDLLALGEHTHPTCGAQARAAGMEVRH